VVHFKSRADAARARLPLLVKRRILARIDEYEKELAKVGAVWDADAEGYFTLLGTEEADAPLVALGWTQSLRDLVVEVVHFHPIERLWEVVYCPSNGWAWTGFVCDSPALPHEVRAWLLANAGEADAALARKVRP